MKFHSNIYGWEYVWRDFADDRKGQLILDESGPGTPTIVALHVPLEKSGLTATITPFLTNGKKAFESASITVSYNGDGLQMQLRSERRLDQFQKMMGLQDIVIGDQLFDSKFLIQGNDEPRVRDILMDVLLRDLLLLHPSCELRVLGDAAQHLPTDRIGAGCAAVVYSQDTLADKFEHLDTMTRVVEHVLHLSTDDGGREAAEAVPQQSDSGRRRLHSPFLDAK